MNWAALVDSLKNLTGFRFYFIVTLIFLLVVGNIYKDTIVNSFTVYIYQPKERSYYKKVILTNDNIVKSTTSLQGAYLEEQPTINKAFETDDHILVSGVMANPDMKLLRALGFDNVLVYKLHYKETIGEIHLNLKRPPTPQELNDLLKRLSPLMYIYII